jgi:inhibitor of the pro-sigma K processing machinery
MAIYIEVGALLAAFLLLLLLIKFLRNPLLVIGNSVMGIVVFLVLDYFFALGIPINVFSVGLVALGGLAGVVLVVLLHFLGLGF